MSISDGAADLPPNRSLDCSGSGYYEGGLAPVAIGRCRNITPSRATDDIFRVNSGPVLSLVIYVKGVEVPAVRDCKSLVEMAAAEIGPGEAITCLQQGRFRLGSPPQAPIPVTCDVVAPDEAINAQGFWAGCFDPARRGFIDTTFIAG